MVQDFDEIYSQYFSEIYKFVLSLCQNPALAEEITQETFFKALKNIDRFKGNCKLSTWLCNIAKNTVYSHAKKQNKQVDYPLEMLLSQENIEEQFSDRETADAIHKVLHKLKEPYKEVFWLRVFGELSFSQIGALFDKTESWARVTYYRAKVLIKEELQ
ncbi:MAG: sigma-70 family RNA polymerase sigma factor [Clostridia bacterium]|nr:sigma-70 family RNA polymerase sigma factor [Clostridia bacterium]